MKASKTNPQMTPWLIWITVLLVFLSGCDSNITPLDAASATPLASRKVESATISGAEVWRVRTGPPNSWNYGEEPPYLFVLDDMVIVSSSVSAKISETSLLTAYSLSAGQVVWQTKYSGEHDTTTQSACFDKAGKRLYLMYSFGVGAFDLSTGQQLWQTEPLGSRGQTFADCQKNSDLEVRSDARYLFSIDHTNGKVLSMEQKYTQQDDPLLFSRGGVKIFSLYKSPGTLVAKDNDGQVLWQKERYMNRWPLFVEGNDILTLSDSKILVRMNYRTGQVIWEDWSLFVSNYVVLDGKVFVLKSEGKLVALDVNSGQEIGNVKFDRSFADSFGEASFFVAAQSPYVVVYFGDTQELVAFKFDAK